MGFKPILNIKAPIHFKNGGKSAQDQPEPVSSMDESILSLISSAEVGDYKENGFDSPYDVPFGFDFVKSKKKLSEMSVAEVIAYQDKLKKATKGKIGRGKNTGTTAVGRYQILKNTLVDAVDKLGLDMDSKFDQKVQDKIAKDFLLERRGYSKFKNGEMKADDFQYSLSKEFSTVPVPVGYENNEGVKVEDKGVSYYGGPAGNEEFKEKLEEAVSVEQFRIGGRIGSNFLQQEIQRLRGLRDSGDPDYADMSDTALMEMAEINIKQNGLLGQKQGFQKLGSVLGSAAAIGASSIGDDAITPAEDGLLGAISGAGQTFASTGNLPLALGAGVVGGAINFFSNGLNRAQSAERERRNAEINTYNRNINFDTGLYAKKGGQVDDGDENGKALVLAQAEVKEEYELDGNLYKVHAKLPHSEMSKKQVTDIFAEPGYVFPEQTKLLESDLDEVIGYTEPFYSEIEKNRAVKKITLRDEIGNAESYADGIRAIKRNYKVVKPMSMLDEITNDENKEHRREIVAHLKNKNEVKLGNIDKLESKEFDVQEVYAKGGSPVILAGGGYPSREALRADFEKDHPGVVLRYDPSNTTPGMIDVYDATTGQLLGQGTVNDVNIPRIPSQSNQPNINSARVGQVDLGRTVDPLNPLPNSGIRPLSNPNTGPGARSLFAPKERDLLDNRSSILDFNRDVIREGIDELDISSQDVASDRAIAIKGAENIFSNARFNNALNTGIGLASVVAQGKPILPALKKPFIQDQLSASEIKASQENVFGGALSTIREVSRNGGDLQDALEPVVITNAIAAAGKIGAQGASINQGIKASNEQSIVNADNNNTAESVRVDNLNNRQRAFDIRSSANVLSRGINNSQDIRTREFNAIRGIDVNSSAQQSVLRSQKIRLRNQLNRGELTREEFDLRLKQLEQTGEDFKSSMKPGETEEQFKARLKAEAQAELDAINARLEAQGIAI